MHPRREKKKGYQTVKRMASSAIVREGRTEFSQPVAICRASYDVQWQRREGFSGQPRGKESGGEGRYTFSPIPQIALVISRIILIFFFNLFIVCHLSFLLYNINPIRPDTINSVIPVPQT
jgi:hypothetical protein